MSATELGSRPSASGARWARAGTRALPLALLLFAACDGSTEPRVPAVLEVVRGDLQTAPVGQLVPVVPAVRVRDQTGAPLAGAPVTFTATEGGGGVAASVALTDTQGIASAEAWTLGTKAGANALAASAEGVAPVTFRATAEPGEPATVAVASGAGQQGPVAEVLPTPPSVRVADVFGNVTPGVEVSFRITSGSGTVEGALQHTNPEGVATVGAWRLGSVAGENFLEASVAGGAAAVVVAHALPGPASVMLRYLGDGGTAEVATALPTPPVVRVADAYGNPVPGVQVSFAVAPGAGSVEPAAVATDADGLAAVTRWTLGSTAGAQTLTATATGVPSVSFGATAAAGAPASLAAVAGQSQSAVAGSAVTVRPAARVTDVHGNPVSGTAVTFAATSGGGWVTGPVQTSDVSGVATVAAWTLGPTAGLNTLEARLANGATVRFEATATASSGGGGGGVDNGTFDIDLRFGSGLTASQQAVFREAVRRWQEIVTGDLPGVPITLETNGCGPSSAMNELVDDIVIHASARAIDGVSGVLGRAGPCLVRSASFLPVVGFMEFDSDDLAALESSGELMSVTLHEIGHVLGIGTVWESKGLLSGKGTTGPSFPGALAVAAFDAVGGVAFAGDKVPVENTGGSGTREAHWRESVLGAELMTGYVNGGVPNPLSAVTAASLADLGYTVDVSRADPYTLAGAARSPGAEQRRTQLLEQPIPPPIVVGPDGVPIRPRD